MADRFPSLEGFSESQMEAKGNANLGIDGLDENVDFLSREKAALGDDAAQFAGHGDNAARVEDEDDDLLGGAGDGHNRGEGLTDFESSYPAIDASNERVAPGGTITRAGEPFTSQPSYGGYEQPEIEPEVIKQWRERRDLSLQHRSEVSATRKAETVKEAQTAIDDFYENYNTKKDKTIAQTRKEAEGFLANREDTSVGGTSWERIAKLVDVSGKGTKGGAGGTGKERFRELLVSLRKDEKAPGSTGY
ncbi:hypothetical protein MMC09_002590 [Bachmanniomyces sp. S44760]|nr:hypothetical protein [Bachmanniomyces sp. S44760]